MPTTYEYGKGIPYRRYSLRVPEKLAERMEAAARDNEETYTSFIVNLLRSAV